MGRVLLVLTPLPLILLGFSLGYYLYQVRNYPLSDLNSVKPMDCAVVLTGAKARVPWALQALKQSRFQKLLISGVHPQTRKEQLLSFTTDTPETLHEAIFIDQQSRSTTDNAYYSLSWATQQSCESLGHHLLFHPHSASFADFPKRQTKPCCSSCSTIGSHCRSQFPLGI
jgi:hypothetical protein